MRREVVVQFGNPVLRQVAQPVTVFHKKLHALIDSIKFTLQSRDDGAALAAPQISVSRRIVVIDYQDEYIELINPQILEMSGEIAGEEGCLSFQGFSGEVKRAETVKVKFQDRYGKEITLVRSGPMARCMQHEIDHLDGILYIDRMNQTDVLLNEKDEKIEVTKAIEMAGKRPVVAV